MRVEEKSKEEKLKHLVELEGYIETATKNTEISLEILELAAEKCLEKQFQLVKEGEEKKEENSEEK